MCKQCHEQRDQSRGSLYVEDGRFRRYRAKYSCDNDANEEKHLHRDPAFLAEQSPDQASGKESVIKPLIRCEHSRLFGKLGREPESTQTRRLGPEKHLQNQNIQMLGSNERDKYSGELFHQKQPRNAPAMWLACPKLTARMVTCANLTGRPPAVSSGCGLNYFCCAAARIRCGE